ncbi:MAG: hypothetical protein CVV64_04725 [Candidatus Wallbacteria bacterium HGW-Wallbacteria-1]|uniref:Cyclic nucleotide-binding domain-containing protein n=1 Tax=Candidatus Wallbacteria bacterium HGW-Wallbacteria-1 TaxID=2013854 RepID=A0A2N1PRW3_9BACT|nr:MAG: hypothetical protein CVV64_04725 [Candidatus Wallbacteria bacterium HGW-Wallbacteria-1]
MSINTSVLEMTPLLFSLNDDEVKIFCSYLKAGTYSDGDILFREGDEGNYLCVIARGSIGIARQQEDGELKILWELPENKVFGELALFDGQPRSGTAVCIGDTEVYFLHQKDFMNLSNAQPSLSMKITLNVIKVLSSNLRTTTARFYQASNALQEN